MLFRSSEITSLSSVKPEQQFIAYELVDQKDPILTTNLEEFDFSDKTLDINDIASRLIATCKFHNVYGIAANQCGLPYKVGVAGAENNFVAFINPVIISSEGEDNLPESDLSNMGLILHVKRPKSIVVQYIDYTGETKVIRLDGLTARIVQQIIERLTLKYGLDFEPTSGQESAFKAVLRKTKTYLFGKGQVAFQVGRSLNNRNELMLVYYFPEDVGATFAKSIQD